MLGKSKHLQSINMTKNIQLLLLISFVLLIVTPVIAQKTNRKNLEAKRVALKKQYITADVIYLLWKRYFRDSFQGPV